MSEKLSFPFEYTTLKQATKELNCGTSDLLHLAATGYIKLNIEIDNVRGESIIACADDIVNEVRAAYKGVATRSFLLEKSRLDTNLNSFNSDMSQPAFRGIASGFWEISENDAKSLLKSESIDIEELFPQFNQAGRFYFHNFYPSTPINSIRKNDIYIMKGDLLKIKKVISKNKTQLQGDTNIVTHEIRVIPGVDNILKPETKKAAPKELIRRISDKIATMIDNFLNLSPNIKVTKGLAKKPEELFTELSVACKEQGIKLDKMGGIPTQGDCLRAILMLCPLTYATAEQLEKPYSFFNVIENIYIDHNLALNMTAETFDNHITSKNNNINKKH